jgi:hypothetical protein
VYEFEVRFTLKSRPDVGFSFDRAIQLGVTTLETREGKVHGTMTLRLESGDPNAAREKALEEAEKIASLLSLALDAGFAVEEVHVVCKPVIEVMERDGVKKITVSIYEILTVKELVSKIYSVKKTEELEIELQNLANRIEKGAHGRDLLRAIKWWRKGYLEEDKVDAFLHYYIALEVLASVKGYKDKHERNRIKRFINWLKKSAYKYEEGWVKRFTKDYSITYKPDGRTSINKIRGRILHAPGPEKDAAEKLAAQCADKLGQELLNAIKRVLEELPEPVRTA